MTGVSGSGKSTLVNDILYKALMQKVYRSKLVPGRHKTIEGTALLDKVINIDQSPIGRTPRSNPATYTGVFDHIRKLFATTQEAKVRGYQPGRFSFNVKGGRCEGCAGDGTIKIEMHFLPDVYVPCEECKGQRYNRDTLDILFKGKSIAEVLDMPCEEALEFFSNQPNIARHMQTIVDVGLGYVRLGQASTTLSGGEAQRVKLASELSKRGTGHTIYILDEPTTGSPLRGHPPAADGAAAPGGPGQHRAGDRAQPRRDQDRRLDHRPRSRGRRRRWHGVRRGHPRDRRQDAGVVHRRRSWHRCSACNRQTGAAVLRLARWSLFLGTALVVLGLGKVHAKYLGLYDFTGSYRFGWSIAYIVLLCVGAYGVGLPDLPRNAYQALWSSLGAAVIGAAGMSTAQLVLGSQLLPRFVIFWSAVFLIPGWSLTGFIAARDRQRQRRRDRVLLVADEDDVERLSAELARSPERRATVVDVLKPEEASAGRLLAAASDAHASVVVLAREALNDDAVIEQVADLHEHGVRVRTLTLFYDEWLGKLPLSELERVALMFDIGEIHRARYGRFKRALDLLVAVAALPFFLVSIPIVFVANLAANRGPLFYRQRRVGRNNDEFTIWKFRTMRPDASAPTTWTVQDDPRVTPLGRMLRKSHIDELPQTINLLRGEISTVGPRPEQPSYVNDLTDKIRFYRLRHLVRPGVTGWAQVKYDYGASDADAIEKLQYEFWYLRHQSLTLDLRIVGRTLRSFARGGGR